MGEKDGFYAYVKIDEMIHWLAKGWTVASELDCHHGAWSVIMRGPE